MVSRGLKGKKYMVLRIAVAQRKTIYFCLRA